LSQAGELNPLLVRDNCPGDVLEYEIDFADGGMTIGTGNVPGEVLFPVGTNIVTYTLTDASGNSVECSFVVIVLDTQAPVQANCGNPLFSSFFAGNNDLGECSSTLPGSIIVTDNCDEEVSVEMLVTNPDGSLTLVTWDYNGNNLYTTTYTFQVGFTTFTIYVTDSSGNQNSCTEQILINDNEDPEITCPGNAVITTSNLGNTGDCTGSYNWTHPLPTDNCEIISYSYRVVRADGTIDGPFDVTGLVQGAPAQAFNASYDFPIGTSQVQYFVADASGNTTACQFSVTVSDDENPVFVNCPEGVTYTIGADADCNNGIIWSIPIAEDNCEVEVVQTAGPMQGLQLSLGTYEIQYTATDLAGNTATCNFTIVVEDDDTPYLVCQPDREVSTDEDLCSWESAENELNPLLVRDNCPGDVLDYEIDFADNTNASGLGDVPGGTIFTLGVNTVTYTLTDTAGNVAMCTFNITVFDEQAPEIMCPADLTIECADPANEMLISDWIDSATATDNCPGDIDIAATVFFMDSQCGNTETILYRFVATDLAENTSECFANVVIEDTTPPSIDMEAEDIVIQCDGTNNVADLLAWLNTNGGAVATDLCGEVAWSNDYDGLIGDCGLTGGVEVTFTATDECGNTSTTSATFTVIDTIPPFWEILPQNLNIECDGTTDPYEQINAWLNIVGGAEAEDNCSFVMYENDFEELVDGCSDFTGSALVTFTAIDACGNTVTAQATVNVVDNVGPTIVTMARDTTVECDGMSNLDELASWLANNGGAEATDLCSEPLTWFNELVSLEEGCGTTSVARYRFWAVDECENASIFTEALFTIEDTTAPVFDELPEDLVVECDGTGNTAERDAWLAANANLVASDVCGEIASIEFDLVSSVSTCGLTSTQLYRFTIVDDCGNTATAEASFIIEDTTPPVITGGADMTMEECTSPPAGNYPEFDFWLTNNAGATAEDACGPFSWSNNFRPENWIQQCGNTRFVDVTFYATDVCGNVDSITHRFAIGDITPPTFTNCPRPPIIESAPDTWCSAFVNFSPVAAIDNCSAVTINQIDTTGLGSGSLFPVGLTILEWEAVDECDNRDTCILKIVVNDFHTPPTISCPTNREVDNDPLMCGAVVNGIAPSGITDNCPDNLSVTYVITDETTGEIISDGILDASGFKFPEGQSRVLYRVADQPILLITEVINDGTVTGVEITNFGPTNYNISCLLINREGPDSESYEVPNGTVLAPGQVYTQDFTPIPAGTPVGYYISFINRIIDGVALNAYVPVNFTWSGDLTGDNVIRIRIWDTDSADDYLVVNGCDEGSYGLLNPELTDYIFPANGALTALQSEDPSIAECSFVVTVSDTEPPYCAELETFTFDGSGGDIGEDFCTVSAVNVGQNFLLGQIRVLDVNGQYPNMGQVTIRLTSPQGTQVVLVDRQCIGSADFDVSFDDNATDDLTSLLCGPLGQGGTYQPLEELKAFFGENVQGMWTLEIYTHGTGTGVLNGWTLELSELAPYSQMDVVLDNDPGLCGAEFTWTHAVFADNCCVGTISVSYDNEDGITIPGGGILPGVGGQQVSRFFPVGTTRVIYTLVDQFGNSSTCGFDVTVVDVEAPVIVACPDDVTIQLNPGECDVLYNYPAVLATDNCVIESITFDPPRGTRFPIGTTTVLVTVTDEAGNTATCEFDVTVLEFIPTTNTMVCNGDINLSLGPDCIAFIHPDMILEGDLYRCYDNYCVTISTGSGHIIGTSADGTNFVTEEHIGMSLMVEICTDCNDPQANCCWGIVNIEHKLIPNVACPEDVTIECSETGDPDMTGIPELLTCSPGAEISYFDIHTINDECGNPRAVIDRVWSLRTTAGHVVNCVQEITVRPFNFDNIVWPEDLVRENALDCNDVAANPSLTHPNNTGFPTLNGSPIIGHHLCEFNISYTDEEFVDANCEGSYGIIRQWSIWNECEPVQLGVNPMRYLQAIKVEDRRPPIVKDCPDDITVSTSTHICRAHVDLGNLSDLAFDECGELKDVQVMISSGSITEFPAGSGNTRITNLRKGVYPVRLRFRDLCRNTSECEFNITVLDLTPPVVIAKEFIVVSLVPGGPDIDGNAKLYAEHVDNGSYDACGPVKLEIRREDGAPACDNLGVDGYNNNLTYTNEFPRLNPNDDARDTDGGDFVKVCCEDLTAALHDVDGDGVIDTGYIRVFLRVWDDADENGLFGTAGDNYNEGWAYVKVEDKLPPIIQCPDDASILCDWPIDQSTDFGGGFQNTDQALFDKTGFPTIYTTCPQDLLVEFQDRFTAIPAGNNCGLGRLTRTFRATKMSTAHGNSSPVSVICTQIIEIENTESTQPWVITPPPNTAVTGMPCTGPTQEDIRVNGPTWVGGPCDVIGESIKVDSFLFEDGVCKKWLVTYNYRNWCTDEQRGPFFREFKYEDNIKPEFEECIDTCYAVDANCSLTGLRIHKTATDEGGCTDQGWLKWQVFVDLWADGTIDYEFTSFVPPGTNREIIVDGVPRRQIYVAPTLNGAPIRGQGNQLGLLIPEDIGSKLSKHKVEWKVTDGCHNFNSCVEHFTVEDKKAPTPYCLHISTAFMSDGTVEIWARDYDFGSFDNCTDQEDLRFTFDNWRPQFEDSIIGGQLINADVAQYFNANGFVTRYPTTNQNIINMYNQGQLQVWLPGFNSSAKVFTCEDLANIEGNVLDVQITVWDKSGNHDFCTVQMTIVDNNGACGEGGMARIEGNLYTESGEMLMDASVWIMNDILPEHPRYQMTDEDGFYAFNNVVKGFDYEIGANKNDDPTNGVSTLDLVLIQRHILGLQLLDSPYKLIAADINSNAAIQVSDLVELRRLILGAIDNFLSNESWRFVDASHEFDDPTQPWNYEEIHAIHDLQQDNMSGIDFIAVKIGDVNGNAEVNLSGNNVESRTSETLSLVADNKVVAAGDRLEMPVRSDNFTEVYGYQLTASLKGLKLVEVRSGVLNVGMDNVATPGTELMTMSWNASEHMTFDQDEVLFTLIFEVTSGGALSDKIKVNSDVTRAESYLGSDMQVGRVVIEFRSSMISEDAGYYLGQNEPNPFRDQTQIRYVVPDNGDAKFTIFDINGRLIMTRTEQAVKGENILMLEKSDLNSVGVYYYQMESGDFRQLKKMIVIE
jgi:subtilisin-like proprotein convertase family protein